MKKFSFSLALFVAIISASLLPVMHTYAATCTWTGSSSALWSDPSNWSGCGGVAPTNGDDVVFPNGTPNKTNQNDIVGLTLNTLSITSTAGGGYAISGNDISVTTGITFGGTWDHTVSLNITLTADQTIDNTGSGTPTISGNLVLNNTLTTIDGNNKIISGVISGAGNLRKIGTGRLALNGNNTYTGTTTIDQGFLTIGHNNALGATSAGTDVNSSGTLAIELVGINTAEPLSIDNLGASGNGTLNVQDGGEGTFSGPITLVADTRIQTAGTGIMYVTGDITELAPSTLTARGQVRFSGNNVFDLLYFDDITPVSAYIRIAGNQPAVTVEMHGGELQVTGTIGAFSAVAGLGNPVIYINNQNNISNTMTTGNIDMLGINHNLNWDVSASAADVLNVNGTVDLNQATLALNNLGGAYTLGQSFTILNNDGADAITSNFSGIAQGGTVTMDEVTFTVSYTGGTGNDITLTVSAVASVATTTTLASDINPSAYGETITLTATTTCTYPAGATVEFYDGATLFDTDVANSSGIASVVVSNLSVGTHNLTASYLGNASCDPSTSAVLSHVIDPDTTTTTLSSNTNPAAINQAITYTITVTSAFGTIPTGNVYIYEGVALLGTGTLNGSGSATISATFTTTGAHSIHAEYYGDTETNPSASAVLAQQVTAASVASSGTGNSQSGNVQSASAAQTLSSTGQSILTVITLASGVLFITLLSTRYSAADKN